MYCKCLNISPAAADKLCRALYFAPTVHFFVQSTTLLELYMQLRILLDNLTDDAIAQPYVMKFSTISLYLTKRS